MRWPWVWSWNTSSLLLWKYRVRHSGKSGDWRNKQGADQESCIRLAREFGLYPVSDGKLMKGFKQERFQCKIYHCGISVDDRFKDGKPGGKETNEN